MIDRPPLNVLDAAVQDELTSALNGLLDAGDVRCLLVRGEGTTAFSVGADVKALHGATDPDPWLGAELSGHWSRLLESFPGLTVSCIRGHCLGGGLELALCTDVRIASPDAWFGFPEVRLGLVPGMGGTARLPRAVGESWAKRMVMSGTPVSAEQACRIGLVQEIAADPRAAGLELARSCMSAAPLAQLAAKVLISHPADPAELWAERAAWSGLWASRDGQEGIAAFVDKRRAIFLGDSSPSRLTDDLRD
ncbi:MAG TPA: enoyl-CoA hydratase/isomerase family protein [Mycobacteriales bacterium]